MRAALALLALLSSASCGGTTGYKLVAFHAAARGPSDAIQGRSYAFTTTLFDGRTFHVALTKAVLHVGAVYLNQSVPTSGSGPTTCALPGVYVGEVRGNVDIDMLSPEAQPLPDGDGTSIHASTGEVWLTSGDVNAASDSTVVLSLAGQADREGATFPFKANITIDRNRIGAVGGALPGASPICKKRIVSPILTDIDLTGGGTLTLRLDPKALFVNVDFSQLKKFSDDPVEYGFSDDDSNQPSVNLFANLRSAGDLYRFEWSP